MITIPEFKAHLYVEIYPGEGVLILSEKSKRVLQGQAYELVIPLINGQRSVEQIVDHLAGQLDAASVYYILNLLEKRGYLTQANPGIPGETAAFWSAMGINPQAAQDALQKKKVAVLTTGNVDLEGMIEALADGGIKVGKKDEALLWIVLTYDYQRLNLANINKTALEENKAWILARVNGPEMWLGPLFVPGETGCWECLKQKLQRNRIVHKFVASRKDSEQPPLTSSGFLANSRKSVYQILAQAAAQNLSGMSGYLEGKVLSLDWKNWEPRIHQLIQIPDCPACGDKPESELNSRVEAKMDSELEPQELKPQELKPQELEPLELKPLELKSGKASFLSDGGYRQVEPEETLKRYKHLVSPITGVVNRLKPVLQEGIFNVYISGHNSALKNDRLEYLKKSLRSYSAGKGISAIQAKVSALCEAIERYSGEERGSEIRVRCSYKDWDADKVYHPNDIMLYSDSQYKKRKEWNQKGLRFARVPEPFPTDLPVDWTPLWSLTAKCHKYLPTQFLYFGADASKGDDSLYSPATSNGNASGNTIEEAILQGFFELIERDSAALWWYNRLSRPGVELESFAEPCILQLRDFYKIKYKREVWALDLTSDLGIPAFTAISRVSKGRAEKIFFGFGCHLDARIALQRAFAEMNQMLCLNNYKGSDDQRKLGSSEVLKWLQRATIDNQSYLIPDSSKPYKRLNDYPVQQSGDFLKDINYCREIIEKEGMEMLVLNQSRSDIGMPVVKVVVPGLRHFWARFAAGRLYDVPVKMGWRHNAIKEKDLNPIPMFI